MAMGGWNRPEGKVEEKEGYLRGEGGEWLGVAMGAILSILSNGLFYRR